jgi:hypothetical protein
VRFTHPLGRNDTRNVAVDDFVRACQHAIAHAPSDELAATPD